MSAEQTEKQKFRNILLEKPSWRGLAGSELEDIITTYVGQRAEAVLFEIERGRQENFLQLARDRESILARAEAEGYVPALPQPLQMEVKIINEGTEPVSLKDLLNPPRPLELIADDETKLVLGDNLLSIKGPPANEVEDTSDEPSETDEDESEDEGENLEPENTVTKIVKEPAVYTTENMGQSRYTLALKQFSLEEGETAADKLPESGERLEEYALSVMRAADENDIPDAGSSTLIVARIEGAEFLRFRVFDNKGEKPVDISENDPQGKQLDIAALKKKLSARWGERTPANGSPMYIAIPEADQSAIIHDVLSITGRDHSVVLARKAGGEEAEIHFLLFDRAGNRALNKIESEFSDKTEHITALKSYLKSNTLWPAPSGETIISDTATKSRILDWATQITNYIYKRQTLREVKKVTVSDTYPTGKLTETLTETTAESVTEINPQGNLKVIGQDVSEVITVTETIARGDEDPEVVTTTRRADPDTKIITETVVKDGKTVSLKITNPNTGGVQETLYDKPGDGENTIIENFVDLEEARIRTETTLDDKNQIAGSVKVFKTVEDDDKTTVTFMERANYLTPGKIVDKTIIYNEDGELSSIYIKPDDALEKNGEVIENKGKIIQDGKELNGEVRIVSQNGTTTDTLRTTENNGVVFNTTETHPGGTQKLTSVVITANGAKTTTETDPATGTTTITRIDSEGEKTVDVEFGDLPAGGSAIVNARQLWKEVAHFRTSSEPGKVFQEFIVGGPDEHGDFTIHDFEVEINGEKWRKEQNFLNGGPESKIYHVYYRLSDELAFRLGDGEVGKIPPPESGVKVTVWRTSGDSVFMTPGQDITPLVDADDSFAAPGRDSLSFVGGRVLERGQPLENIELVRKSVLSHIQVGGVAARNVDYEYKIRRRFPDLLYLKVWGEKEQVSHDENTNGIDNNGRIAYINKAFFTFLIERKDEEKDDNDPDYKARQSNVQTAIEDYFNGEIKPMNVEPKHEPVNTHGFIVKIEGAIDRVYPDISKAQEKIEGLLKAVFGRNRSEKNLTNFLEKFPDPDKREKFTELFQRYSRLNGLPKESDIHHALRESGYFRDAQPHLNRRNRPYYEVTLGDWVDSPPPKHDFFDQYIYLEQIEFSNKASSGTLCYADNF